jgi:hypothetical protein
MGNERLKVLAVTGKIEKRLDREDPLDFDHFQIFRIFASLMPNLLGIRARIL